MTDPRRLLVRDGVASSVLEGVVPAERYLAPDAMTARRALALRAEPVPRAEQRDTILVGEVFDVLETARGWAFGQARRDGYVGWVERDGLAPGTAAPTHRVAAVRSVALAEPGARAAGLVTLSLNALVRVGATRDRFAEAEGLGWIAAGHLSPIGWFETDPAAVAERFIGSPYLWGGRGAEGIDCSGLVQAALLACGRGCPRDSDQQAGLGIAASADDLRRGDLVCWPGHIGIMADETRLIHASGIQMAVVVEPLADAVAARKAVGSPTDFRRVWP